MKPNRHIKLPRAGKLRGSAEESMKKHLKRYMWCALVVALGCAASSCKTQRRGVAEASPVAVPASPVNIGSMPGPVEVTADNVLGVAVAGYTPWESVSASGKLRMKGLPLSPTVKIHLERGRSIQLSARMPLMGEVARVEIAGDSVLAIDKVHRNYCVENLEGIRSVYPDAVSDFQTLLLGRIVVAGSGELSQGAIRLLDVADAPGGNYTAVPRKAPAGGNYGYLVGPDGVTLGAMLTVGQLGEASLTYDRSSGYDIGITVNHSAKAYQVLLELDGFRADPQPMKPVEVDRKYTRMGIADFIKALSF